MQTDQGADIRRRSFVFACAVIRAISGARRPLSYPVFDQLLKAATSVGANLEEAKAASSRREFIRMCEISLRESREAAYWIRVCLEVGLLPGELHWLQKEAEEIGNIVGAIVLKTKRKLALQAGLAGAGCLGLLPLLAHVLSLSF